MILGDMVGRTAESPGNNVAGQGVTYGLENITSAGGEYANTTKWPDVPAICPIGGATAASHGHSRVDHPGPRRSQYQQVAGRQRHRVPKLTVQISDVWVPPRSTRTMTFRSKSKTTAAPGTRQ
jgi:hypothetical protein